MAPGTYVENIDFLGKAITVRSTAPEDPAVVAATIIDGSEGVCVTFRSAQDSRSLLRGFTVANGSTGVLCKQGFGVLTFPRPMIQGNTFVHQSGYAIYKYLGSCPDLIANTFVDSVYGVRIESYGTGVICDNVAIGCDIMLCGYPTVHSVSPFTVSVSRNTIINGRIYVNAVYSSLCSLISVNENVTEGGRGIRISVEPATDVCAMGNSLTGGELYVHTYGNATVVENYSYGGGLDIWALGNATVVKNYVSGSVSAGISCHSPDMVVRENVVEGCVLGPNEVGALECYGNGVVEGNVIRNNDGSSCEFYSCGGGMVIAASWRGTLSVRSNLVIGNIGRKGGGLNLVEGSGGFCTIVGNSIVGNLAVAQGGGMYIGDSAVVASNLIAGNYAMSSGGALYLDARHVAAYKPAVVACNTIVGNCSYGGGGAIWMHTDEAVVEIANCVLFDNRPPVSTLDYWSVYSPGRVVVSNSIIEGGEGSFIIGGYPAQLTWGTGNIDADPMFADGGYWWGDEYVLGGDYRLLPGSPCIDAGTNEIDLPGTTAVETLPDLDLAGVKRIIDGNLDGTATVDIGAYEYLPGDVNGDGRVNLLDLLRIRNSLGMEPWSALRRADVNADGRIDLLDLLLTRRLFVSW